MEYDGYGNITAKNEDVYTYDNAKWKDLLTKVGNQTITYDAQGNPTAYLGHTLVWEKGRQLKSFDTNTYTYNANGIRTSKTVNGITHNYILDGTKILKETWGNNVLIPLYDNEDSVCGIEYNGTAYWFYKNLQGDIINIANADGNVIANYNYDAWGRLCSIIDTDGNAITDNSNIAIINPFRYRGYYYDTEIGMYYLQSRYYDPTVGRFINADGAMFSSNAIVSNLFCYCLNEPVSCGDSEGKAVKSVFDLTKSILTLTKNMTNTFTLSISMYLYSIITSQCDVVRDFNSPYNYYHIEKAMKLRLENSFLLYTRARSYSQKAKGYRKSYSSTRSVDFMAEYEKYRNKADYDLAFSVGRATNCNVKVENRGKSVLPLYRNRCLYYVTINLSDLYDFEELGPEKSAFVRMVNNYLGYYPMRYGIVKTYRWKIRHSFFRDF